MPTKAHLTSCAQYVETKNLTLEQIDTLFEGGTIVRGESNSDVDDKDAKMGDDVRVIEALDE